MADLLDRVDTPDATHVEIRLTRAPVKPGSWLLGPIGPAHAGSDGRVATGAGARVLVSDSAYSWSSSEPGRLVLESTAGSSGTSPRIRRIREFRFNTANALIGAFNRGEVAMVEHLPPDRVASFASNPDVKVGRYAHPSMHRIALDGRNPLLRNRALRRGLSYAIDRKTLLEESILKRPSDASNLVADGVFPRGTMPTRPGPSLWAMTRSWPGCWSRRPARS
ncbi:MAG: ABC transporter substrate-binding protein [Isosphaeraceae bacterium]